VASQRRLEVGGGKPSGNRIGIRWHGQTGPKVSRRQPALEVVWSPESSAHAKLRCPALSSGRLRPCLRQERGICSQSTGSEQIDWLREVCESLQ
jgi:hypothetical protein